MRKYDYIVTFAVYATGYVWSSKNAGSSLSGAREAVAMARAVYAALYVALGAGTGGADPAHFANIAKRRYAQVALTPQNKAFIVAIEKR